MHLLTAMEERRSIRSFSDCEISREEIDQLLHQATWAPSAGNRQPWRVVALEPGAAAEAIERFEGRAWEIIYPTLRTVMLKDPSILGRELDGAELSAAVVAFARKTIFLKGRPWLLLVYYRRDRLRDRFVLMKSTFAMLRYRMATVCGLWRKLRHAFFVLGSSFRAVRVDRDTSRASVSNYIYNLTLAAHAKGWGSCIQFTYLLMEPALKKAYGLTSRDEMVGVVALGIPAADRRRPPESFTKRKPLAAGYGRAPD